jgi:diguanylate cyclase (GGDEF)-like protein/PAS domain S-box-containing protein
MRILPIRATTLPLRTQLVLLTLAVTLPVVVGAIFAVSRSASARLRDEAGRETAAAVERVAAAAENWDRALVDLMDTIRGLESVRSMDPRRQRQVLENMARVYPQFTVLHTTGPDGRNVARGDGQGPKEYGDRPYFKGAMAGVPVVRTTLDRMRSSGNPGLAYGVPIYSAEDPTRVAGVLAVGTDLTMLSRQLWTLRFGETGYCYLVDASGRVLADASAGDVSRLTNRANVPAVAAVLKTKQPAEVRYTDERGASWLSYAKPLPNGWAAVGVQQEAEALAGVRKVVWAAAGVAAGATLLVTFLTWRLTARALRPVARLTRAASELAAGVSDEPVPAEGAAELATLARAFNHMTSNLRAAHAGVERQVRERTAELSYLNHELQFHKFAIDQHAIVAITDVRGRITYANDQFCRLSGYAREELIGQDHRIVNSGLHPRGFFAAMYREITAGRVWQGEIRNKAKDGSYYWVDATIVPFRDAGGEITQYVSIRIDITARKLAEERLSHDALHDPLTGLPNRACFLNRLRVAMDAAKADPAGHRVAVLFMDLDRFKVINDSLGHAAGDALLRTMAERLTACTADPIGTAATVARLGGDEFTVLVDGFADPAYPERLASRLLKDIGRPVTFDGREIHTTSSIGLVQLSPGDHHAPEDLLRDADAAMYRAKGAGKNRCMVFDAAMHKAAVDRLHLEHDLRSAIVREQLVLHYQPLMSLETRQLVGFEALARWQHPERGLIPPNTFIPIAEETGLISELGGWVVYEACRQLREWRDENPGLPHITMSVNLARRQFGDPDLIGRIRRALDDHDIPAPDLKLEITESTIMDDAKAGESVLAQLKGMGLELHMDDFGTGHSSLSCLHQFPVDVLKVDRSFIRATAERRDYTAILHAIVELAHNLNVKVVAEGLETPEQVVLLQSLNCDFGQGYFFAKPMEAGKALEFALGPQRLTPAAA